MKKLYWRPSKVSRSVLVLIAIVSLAGITAEEKLLLRAKQPFYKEKLEASLLARRAMDVIKNERLRLGIPIHREEDPTGSGLIGQAMTPITSNTGVLSAKQTSVNPNFAAVLVQLLKRANLKPKDLVAVGISGSFPALAIATLAAIKTLEGRPIVIASASASQFGANIPGLTWLEMQDLLQKKGILPYRPAAVSIGGIEDRGLGMSKDGRRVLVEVMEKSGLPVIKTKSFKESVDERMRVFLEQAAGAPIRVYINIGGGASSVGSSVGKKAFNPGLNKRLPAGLTGVDSVMSRFSKDGVPVIHLVKIEVLAKRYGLPVQPREMPIVGQGKIFIREEYNPYLAAAILFTLLVTFYAFVRSDWGTRILHASRRRKTEGDHPQQMV
jgi:poly-gamma-glutamate system protein